MPLSRAQIDAKQGHDLPVEEVHVPEWVTDGDDVVLVRGLSGRDRDAYMASLSKRIKQGDGSFAVVPNTDNSDARFAVLCMVDENGQRLYRDEDAINVGEMSAAALQRVTAVGGRLSGLTPDAVADAEGNSATTPSDGSTSSGQTPPEPPSPTG